MASSALPSRRRRSRRAGLSRARRDARAGFALVSPTFIVVLTIVVLPVVWALILSFKHVELLNLRHVNLVAGPYTLRNYDLLFGSSEFLRVLRTTVAYSVFSTLGAIVLGLMAALLVRRPFRGRGIARGAAVLGPLAALLVRRPFRGRGIVRGLMLLPWVAPVVALTFVWQVLLSPQLGFVNAIGTDVFGWDAPVPFLSQEHGTITLFGASIGVPTALVSVIA